MSGSSSSLRLAPHEFEALLTPGTGAPDIRSVFRIDTGAGVVRAALHAVGDYDPRKPRCAARSTASWKTDDAARRTVGRSGASGGPGLTTRQAVLRLFELGLVSRRGCEQCAIRDEIGRLEKEGMSRCEAFEVTAGKLCCSYEKVRNAFYNTYKH